jgi:hypothetical protein
MLMPKLFKHVNCPANVISAFGKPCIPLKTSMKTLFMSRNGAQSADCTIVNNDIMYESLEKYNLHHALPLGAAVSDSLKKKIWDEAYLSVYELHV